MAPNKDLALPKKPDPIARFESQEARDKHMYQCLVTNIAALIVQQCNLFQRQVPDSIAKNDKASTLLVDIVTKLDDTYI